MQCSSVEREMMKARWSYFRISIVILSAFLITGCSQEKKAGKPASPAIAPDATIGSLARFYSGSSFPVRGIGIVAGLHGTGSSECPAIIRQELEKYIWKQLSGDIKISARAFIESQDTAVVEVFGQIPPLASVNESFDIMVSPLGRTQTTSLDGGHLYLTELKELSRLSRIEQFSQFSKTVGTAEGPIFTLSQEYNPESKQWYVLGGAENSVDQGITVILQQPSLLTANMIRNRINERFGPKTAIARSSAEITINVPARYQDQKVRFLAMLSLLQLSDNESSRQERVNHYLKLMSTGTAEEKQNAEIGLEAIGKPALDSLFSLLDNSDKETSFFAARCMINIGDDRAIPALRSIILDENSPYRLESINAIGKNVKRNEAGPILMHALSSSDINIRLSAYEMLLRLKSASVTRKIVAGSFAVDSVLCAGPKTIYVFQSQSPRIVVFGAPIKCNENIFIQSEDGSITINSKTGDKYISVSRKHPNRPRVIGPLMSGFEISNLIQTLGELPTSKQGVQPGLALSYSEIISLLEKLCKRQAISAEFVKGPPPEVNMLLEKAP